MKVYFGIQEFTKLPNAVVTSGTFDGVHLGHQKILQRLKEVAAKTAGETVVITFDPHPRSVVSHERQPVQLLSTLDEKINLLQANGIDHLLIIPFTRKFSESTSAEFIQTVLVDTIGTKTLVIGYDHRFGRNREGSFEYLKEHASNFGFVVEEISRHDIDNIGISSSKIRKALIDGEVQIARHFLGKNYTLGGLVVKGKQLGRTIGFPTANIQVRELSKLVPQDGVYAVKVLYKDRSLKGMLNIGNRPTVDGTYKTIEVHILDFNEEIYGEFLEIELIERIRPEIKFSGLEALKQQIQLDKVQILQVLGSL